MCYLGKILNFFLMYQYYGFCPKFLISTERHEEEEKEEEFLNVDVLHLKSTLQKEDCGKLANH